MHAIRSSVGHRRRLFRIEANALGLFLLAYASWLVMWYVPMSSVGVALAETGLPFDLFRYYDAATCFSTGNCVHAEILNNPAPVLFAAVLLPWGVGFVAAVQCACFAVVGSRLLNTLGVLGLPRHIVFAGLACPALLMYLSMPGKEFFSICATIACVDYFVRRRHGMSGWGDLAILVVSVLVATVARAGFLIYPLAVFLAINVARKKHLTLAIVFACAMLFVPKDIEHFQALNENVPSHSAVMQTFRELSASESLGVQAVLTPVRALFYLVFPFPLVSFSGLGLPSGPGELDEFFSARMLSVESLNFLWLLAIAGVLRTARRRRESARTADLRRRLASAALMSILFVAAASPLPQARYRVSSLVLIVFVVMRPRAARQRSAVKPAPAPSLPLTLHHEDRTAS